MCERVRAPEPCIFRPRFAKFLLNSSSHRRQACGVPVQMARTNARSYFTPSLHVKHLWDYIHHQLASYMHWKGMVPRLFRQFSLITFAWCDALLLQKSRMRLRNFPPIPTLPPNVLLLQRRSMCTSGETSVAGNFWDVGRPFQCAYHGMLWACASSCFRRWLCPCWSTLISQTLGSRTPPWSMALALPSLQPFSAKVSQLDGPSSESVPSI